MGQDFLKEFLPESLTVPEPGWEPSVGHLQQILSCATVMAVTDTTGKILEVNDRFCQVSQFARTDLINENFFNRTDARFFEDFQDIWQQVLAGGPWEGEVECSAKSGLRYWIRATIVPLALAGEIGQIVFVGWDITRYRREREASVDWLRSSLWLEHVKQDTLAQKQLGKGPRLLSLREEQVLSLVTEGLANKNIAVKLNLSIRTVEIHRAHLMRKLGLKTTAALVKYAMENGFLRRKENDASQA